MVEKVTGCLDSLGIEYRLLRHPAVVTTEESRRVVAAENCASCKSLYVKDKRSDNYYLLVLPFDKRAEMRKLASYVGCAKFEFATEDKLFEHLGVHRGSVSPFAYLNVRGDMRVPLIIDGEVWNAQRVKFHPCDNTATVVLSLDGFKKFLSYVGVEVIIAE